MVWLPVTLLLLLKSLQDELFSCIQFIAQQKVYIDVIHITQKGLTSTSKIFDLWHGFAKNFLKGYFKDRISHQKYACEKSSFFKFRTTNKWTRRFRRKKNWYLNGYQLQLMKFINIAKWYNYTLLSKENEHVWNFQYFKY